MSALEIKQFCDSMNCTYMEVSTFANRGIEELVYSVIANCIVLEKNLISYSLKEIDKNKEATRTSFGGGSRLTLEPNKHDMVTQGAPDVKPLELKKQKKKDSKCC